MNEGKQADSPGDRMFSIESIEKTSAPEQAGKGEWYRYRIANAMSPIEGVRSGSLKSVTSYLKEYVDNLNTRAVTGASAYGKRNTKK